MKLFECQSCGQRLYFENTHCERCDSLLGFLAELRGELDPVPSLEVQFTVMLLEVRLLAVIVKVNLKLVKQENNYEICT